MREKETNRQENREKMKERVCNNKNTEKKYQEFYCLLFPVIVERQLQPVA